MGKVSQTSSDSSRLVKPQYGDRRSACEPTSPHPSSPILAMRLLALLLWSFLVFVQGMDIKGTISAQDNLPSPALLPPSTLLLLTAPGIQYQTHPSPKGEFTFRNVTAGPSYLFEIECITHSFPSLRIDTTGERVEVHHTFRGNEWGHIGPRLEYPLQITPSTKADYYVV